MSVFSLVLSAATLAIGLLLGYLVFGLKPKSERDDYAGCLIHPDTTPEVKWVKMTRPTRDAIIGIYAANMDDCAKYMAANDRVTTGEAAILWLMDNAK
jgi:hypothetical protein